MTRGWLVAYNGADAGLGNRIRVTLASANLAEAENRRFLYVWPRTPAFEPALQQLWDWDRGRVVPRSISRLLAKVTDGYFDHHLTGIDDQRSKWLWQIRTGGVLKLPPGVRTWQQSFRELRPAETVRDLITTTFDNHLRGKQYVGVQLRVHGVSHHVTREASPVEWYVERMDEIVKRSPGAVFFISSDVPEVKRELLGKYPGSVALEHDHPYNTTESVQFAVADLYLLASASRMLGPHHSSFIEMAEYLTHSSVETEKAREPARSESWSAVPLATDPLKPYLREDSS